MARVFITGGTGFIGRALVRALASRGDEIIVPSRDVERAKALLPEASPVALAADWKQPLSQCDAVVNLAGESIGGRRWNEAFKARLRDSRLSTTSRLASTIAALSPDDRPQVLVSASGVDIYPMTAPNDRREFGEDGALGDTFLSTLCRDWERAATAAVEHGVRVVVMRTGLVLGNGGALAKMAGPFRFFVGGRIGDGRQQMAWIHLSDAVAGYRAALDDSDLNGPVNLVAPACVTNREFASALGRAMGRPSLVPAPAFAIRAAVGEFAQYIVGGRRVVPAALSAAGFAWQFDTLPAALADIYGR